MINTTPLLQAQRILITGGLGYMGGRVSRVLAKNHPMFLRLTTRRHDVRKPDWLEKGDVVVMDLANDDDRDRVCHGMDVVLHIAALNEVGCAQNPEQALIVNGLGTFNMLESAKRCGVRRFIYFSTAHVYGFPLMGKISELTLTKPMSAYAITHKVAEDYVLAAHQRKEIEGLVVRLSNGIGVPVAESNERWTLVVNDLCRQAVVNKRLTLKSAGLQYRDFITLPYVGQAMLHFLQLPVEQLQDGLFNLGGEHSLQIKVLAALIQHRCETLFHYKPPLSVGAQSSAVPTERLIYNIDKLKSTGFRVFQNISEAIDDVLLFCKERLK